MNKFFEKKSRLKGYLLTKIVVVLSVVLWVLIWRLGYIAAIVSFATAFGVFAVFKLGAGEVTKKDILWLSLIILGATLLAFYTALVLDIWDQYRVIVGGTEGFFSADFWSSAWTVLGDVKLYYGDLLMSLGFAVLGAGSLIFDQRKQIETDS